MSDKLADPCTSLFQLACGDWLRSTVDNATRTGNKDLDNVSVMDEKKTSIDKKIKGESLDNVQTYPLLVIEYNNSKGIQNSKN
jgi:hypothetical protein